jgi:hypothetical protein
MVNNTLTAVPIELPAAINNVSFAAGVAAVVAYLPVPFAMLLSKLSGDKMSWRWPFQKENVGGVFGVFLVLGWAACILPVYHATLMLLEIPA